MRRADGRTRFRWVAAALLAGVIASGCVDEKIIEVPRDIFDPPMAEAEGMLGYSDQASKLTSCGNCHVGPQSQWETTGHAEAWEGLQDSGHAQAFCEGCHTVNELGNTLTVTAGYNAVPEDRYHDVQCESCHGPGLDHVQSPADENIPLAAMDVGLDNTQGCGECHQGTHHPFTEQWELSAHGTLNEYPAGREGCNACHEGGGILAAWGENTTYLEGDELFPITCAVCHDPHGSDNEAQLRFPVGGVAIEQNLCSQCHNRRTVPDPGSSHGLHPHSPETALLNGEAGFFFPGMLIDQGDIIATHGSEANERLCAGCHVNSTEVTDAETGEFLFQAVGHTFNAVPCLDENGVPTGGDCELNGTVRDFQSCATSGCHGSASGAVSVLTTASVRFQNLVEELHDLLVQIDPNLDEPGGEIDGSDGVLTTAEGAFFNMELAEFGGTDRPSPLLAYASAAAHNPFLVEQLLIASINAVEDDYGVSASPGLNRTRTMDPR